MAILNFDSTNVVPMAALDPVPSAWYVCAMSASEMKPTSKNDGSSYLECEYDIMAPPEYKGRKLYDRMNLVNGNPTAVEIAYRTLSSICHATGVIQVADSQQLHNRPLMIKVSLRPAGPGADGKHYEASNEVRGYKAVENSTAKIAPVQPVASVIPPTQPAWAPPAPPAQLQPTWTPPAQSEPPAQPAWAAAPPPQVVQSAPPMVAPVSPVMVAPVPPWQK